MDCYKVLDLEKQESQVIIDGRTVDTPYYTVVFDEDYNITRLWDKKNSREVLGEGKKANQLIDRVRYALKADPGIALPDWRMENWPRVLEEITRGWLDNVRSIPDLLKLNWDALVAYALSQEQTALLNKLYPEFFVTKRGYKIRIDYGGETPSAAVRIQELYGVTVHPCIGRKQLPLRLELLSPARRPVQITMDLPGFWKGSWTLVRKDMRGRYPKHDWPEHPEAEN